MSRTAINMIDVNAGSMQGYKQGIFETAKANLAQLHARIMQDKNVSR